MCRPEGLAELHIACAARVSALVDALRAIPDELAPCRRAAVVAVREQIYYGWEQPLARASHAELLFGKYERDGWWSTAAAELVRSGGVVQGTRQLARDHVEPVGGIVAELLAAPCTPSETAALLDTRLLTCTVLADEHRRLARVSGDGWQRYAAAGVAVRRGLPEPRD